MIRRLLAAFASLFSASAVAQTPPAPPPQTTIIHAGRLIADPGRPAQGPSTVTIVDGRITNVTAGLQPAPAGARLIDQSTRTVLPGLIDMHTHLLYEADADFRDDAVNSDEWFAMQGVRNARITLRSGFTTVRDLGAAGDAIFALRRAVDGGLIPGPRIVASGPYVSIIGGHGDVSGFRAEVNAVLDQNNTCTGPLECAARVRQLAQNGANVIKFMATGGVLSQQAGGLEAHFTDEEMRAIVTTARSLGLRTAAHAHGARGIEAAARAGVGSIEHGTFADEAAIRAMRANNVALVPTLMATTGLREQLARGTYTPVVAAKVREVLALQGRAARAAHAAGVPVIFGTDAAVFEHGRNAEEFLLLVELAGMSPGEALASATTGAARLLGLESEIGRIAPGMSADIVAVDGDPLADVRVLGRVQFVMARGRVAE